MELIDIVPEFNLYEEYWKIYTNTGCLPPQYLSEDAVVNRCIIGNGCEIYGEVYNSVIGAGVSIGKGTVVRDSIIMQDTTIGEGGTICKAIIAEDVKIGDRVVLGDGEEVPNRIKPDIYNSGLVTIGERSVVPSDVKIGKNTAISGVTVPEDYQDGVLRSGESLVKAGGQA